MSHELKIERNFIGIQDLLVGVGNVTQIRDGVPTTVTKINAKNLPYDDGNLEQAFLKERASIFVFFSVNDQGELIATYGADVEFDINDEGYLTFEYTGPTS